MRKLTIVLLCVLALAASAFAQNSKATFKVGGMAIVEGNNTDWQEVTTANIKTASGTDLMVGVSMETNLYTNTVVSSKNYVKSTSDAEAGVHVRVLVDGVEAQPGQVTFDRRKQTLVAKLDGFSCQLLPDGTVDLTTCGFTDEEIQLILDTTGAHHFNFIVKDLTPGYHAITVQARLFSNATGTSLTLGNASANAFVGNGSIVIDEVKLANTGSGATVEM